MQVQYNNYIMWTHKTYILQNQCIIYLCEGAKRATTQLHVPTYVEASVWEVMYILSIKVHL